MKFLKNIASAFVEFEEEKEPVSKPAVAAPKETITTTVVPSYIPKSEYIDVNQFNEHFNKLFEDSDLPGPDFREFFNMVGTLKSKGLIEELAYATAFEALKSMGLTIDKLLSTGSHYIGKFDGDAKEFAAELARNKANEVDAPKQQIEEIKKLNEQRLQEIANLNKKITEDGAKIAQLTMEIASKEQKILSLQDGYSFAVAAKKGVMQDVLNKINTYLNAKQ